MGRGILFAIVFIVAGLLLFALLAPILFKGADMQRLGATAFPIIAIVCGVIGFAVGKGRTGKK